MANYDILNKLKYNPDNPRIRNDEKQARIKKSIAIFPDMLVERSIVYDENNMVLGGNGRLKALRELVNDGTIELKDEYLSQVTGWSEEQKRKFIIEDNKIESEWDYDMLANDWDTDQLEDWGLDVDINNSAVKEAHEKLTEKFVVPPFTVFDTKQGYWQKRKKQWIAIGIKSEEGRDDGLLGFSNLAATFGQRGGTESNTSVFDPVLCELVYRWFCINKGKVLDPFAGGSVRGIVAAYLGMDYHGNDLSDTQVVENRKQADNIDGLDIKPTWTIGDSTNIKELAHGEYDLVFSCPPYYDLEVYSDKQGELSNMDWDNFIDSYRTIIKSSCEMLKDDRFACFVVGDIRDKAGVYRNFHSLTIDAFIDAGLYLYNEAILVNVVESLPVRVGKQFNSGRKLGKMHQNVLIFYKGKPANIKSNYSVIEAIGEDLQS